MVYESDYRLPRTAIPHHYDLTLEPDLAEATFAGCAGIELEIVTATDTLTFNAAELEITGAELVEEATGARYHGAVTLDESRGRAELRLPAAVAPGAYRLHLDFTGVLNDQLRGFYRSVYRSDDGVEHVIATTQFESTDARRAFPCWDEPDLKATFAVTLVVAGDLTAVSNSPVVADEPLGDGRRRIRFGQTMKMSTYLVAFIVGELEATGPVDVGGVPLRVVHRPGKGHLTAFALDIGTFALRFFAEYYGLPYPGEKIDMIGIPDFAFGAMENLGAITFRESVLLIDPATATQAELARVADVVSHELAHMWFGDLVTMKWWNGIWLNEAFATFMEIMCVDAYRPDWKRWLSFAAQRNSSMDVDGLVSTRPIEFPVASPEEADEMFDVLTYSKGGAVLRMLEQYLGAETFRRGISRYLTAHAYANTDTGDLWAALEAESGEPVGEIMSAWIFQGGHPCIEVTRVGDGYRLHQRRFQFLGETETRWKVPVLHTHDGGAGSVLVGADGVNVPAATGLLLNDGGHGYYRVQYEPDHLAAIATRIGDLDAGERYALVSDTWAAVLAGTTSASDYLRVVQRLGDEPEAEVWSLVLEGLGELDRVVSSDVRPGLQAFVRDLAGPAAARMGWAPEPGESDLERGLRGVLIRALGVLGRDQETIDEARRQLPAVIAGAPVDGEVAAAIVAIVAATGDWADFATLRTAWQTAGNPQDEERYLDAMAAVPDLDAVTETLDMVCDGRIRSHNAGRSVSRLVGSKVTGPAAWEAVTARWDDVIARVPTLTARSLLATAHLRSEPGVADSIRDWLETHPIASAAKYTAQQLERLSVRVGLREREAGLHVPPPAGPAET